MSRFSVLFLILLSLSVAGRAQDETEKYTLGVGDTLRINVPGLFGAPQDKSVRRDGTIELSIAGGRLLVAGSTADEIAAKVKALAANLGDYRVSVFVLRYASHPVAATGSVREPGIKYLTRDAVPVYVFRAVSIPDPAAEGVEIQRADGSSIACHFDECEKQKVLIRSGDAVRFMANTGVARSDRR
ncbi:MAG TPA: polysaccharide biosynthesis/export family protein [Pyrinomonadaceae bacterium]|nr:polysaccharide biosynthesis/export family protein [Pyrinomonadaceae bacterium]